MNLAIDLARRRAAGFGSWSDFELPDIVVPPGGPSWDPAPPIGSDSGSDDIPWYVAGAPVFGVIGKTLSNIFGNQYQQQTYVQPRTQQYQLPPAGYGYDSSGRLVQQSVGNITSFITSNPLLVGGAILGVILLFRSPPGRR